MPGGGGRALVIGPGAALDLQAELRAIATEPGGASTIPATAATRLVMSAGLESSTDLALLALPVADALARPGISGYRVAAVGIEAETGDLLLGGNLEFPGSDLTTTIHAEGFVALRARNRGRSLATLAVRSARPCAHCRQTLAESATASELTLVDLDDSRRTLADLYPWPFWPAALGVVGDTAGRVAWPALAFVGAPPPPEVAVLLREAGGRAHAPYSGAPSAVVVRTARGRVHAAGCVESVAFNPSISALQAAIVEVVAGGEEPREVREAWLARMDGGQVNAEPGFRALLHAVAPDAEAHVVRWQLG